MALNPIPSNPGKVLTSSTLGGEESIPPEFRAAMERVETTQQVNVDVTPTALSDTVVESRTDQTQTNERIRHVVSKKSGTITLLGTNTNDSGQSVQVTRTMYYTGNFTPAPPNATTNVAIRDLGNGRKIAEVGVEGTYSEDGTFTPGVFDKKLDSRQIADILPTRFQGAAPVLTIRTDIPGTTATPATLGDGLEGNLESSAERLTQFVVREQNSSRNVTLPLVLTTFGYTEDFGGGLTTITDTLNRTADLSTYNPDISTLDFNEVQINDTYSSRRTVEMQNYVSIFGTQVEANGLPITFERLTVPAGTVGGITTNGYTSIEPLDFLRSRQDTLITAEFPNPVEVRSQKVEVIPQKYLGGVTVTTTTTRTPTNYITPTVLGNGITGITSSTVERFSSFENRSVIEERDVTLPIAFAGKKLTTQFGGGVLSVTDTLTSSAPTLTGSLITTEYEYSQLDSGVFDVHKEFLDADAWPILYGTLVDETTGVSINYTKQVVAAGTTGGISGTLYTEIQPVDKWRSIAITSDLSTIVLPDATTYSGTYDVKEPDVYSTESVNATSGDVYSERRTYSRTAGYSGPRIVSFTEGYLDAASVGSFGAGLTGRQISSGNSAAYTNSYATTGDRPYAETFATSDPVSDTVIGSVLSLRLEKLRYGIWRYILVTY